MTSRPRVAAAAVLAAAVLLPTGAAAQEAEAPRRTRVALGPALVPRYPGSDEVVLRPFADFSRTRDEQFTYEAADESAGFSLLNSNGFAIGPAVAFQGRRRSRDVGGALPRVGFTVEAGGFVQYALTDAVRLRVEARKGIGGHKGFIGSVGADYVARDGDRWLFALGPRVTLADDRYQRAYFGVRARDALAAGLPVYRAEGGVQAVGLTANALTQVSGRWGLQGYAKYDRLVGDAADSPVVRAFGSRNQLSGGVALTYTFGG